MKAQMIEKSGFPKPLGLLLILIIMGLLCLVQCVFSQPLDTTSTDNRLYYARVEEETEIQIEAGMIEKSYLLKDYKFRLEAEESEPEISIEPWMLNFEKLKQELADNDPESEIEEWMIDDSFWLISTDSFNTQNEVWEEEIKLEEWMYDLKNYWREVFNRTETGEGN